MRPSKSVYLNTFFILSSSVLYAEDISPNKDHYTLFNPTPKKWMRELSTDRPDQTESPYTVDAGHYQIEMDLLNYAYDRHNPAFADISAEAVSIAPVNLKAGLCNHTDLQLILQPYTHVRVHDRTIGRVENNYGFGDIVTRLKWNIWGK